MTTGVKKLKIYFTRETPKMQLFGRYFCTVAQKAKTQTKKKTHIKKENAFKKKKTHIKKQNANKNKRGSRDGAVARVRFPDSVSNVGFFNATFIMTYNTYDTIQYFAI